VHLTVRDIVDQPLTADELRSLAPADLSPLLSTKSPTFKALGKDPASLSQDEILALLQQDPRMIRRPLIVVGDRLVTGFDKPALEAALS
jgi:arsenate reductase-like glutaredoxin family protein